MAVGWSGYASPLLMGIGFPELLTQGPELGGLINLPAIAIIALVTGLLLLGTLTTNFVNIYMSALALKSLRPATGSAAAVWLIGGVGAALSILGKFWFDQFVDGVALLAAVFVPIGGVLLAHFLVLGGRPDPASLYPDAATEIGRAHV